MKHDKENREISTVNLDFLINALFKTKQKETNSVWIVDVFFFRLT